MLLRLAPIQKTHILRSMVPLQKMPKSVRSLDMDDLVLERANFQSGVLNGLFAAPLLTMFAQPLGNNDRT